MGTQRDLLESMSRAGADHEILDLYIQSFNTIFGRSSPKAIRESTKAARLFLSRRIVDHFAYEEQRIFPSLLENGASEEVRKLIARLREEHQALVRDAKRLDKILGKEENAYNRTPLLRKSMVGFFHKLEKHASKENELFPSLL